MLKFIRSSIRYKMSQGIKFYNRVETCVDDSLSGFVNLYPGLKLFPAYRFITKTNVGIYLKSI